MHHLCGALRCPLILISVSPGPAVGFRQNHTVFVDCQKLWCGGDCWTSQPLSGSLHIPRNALQRQRQRDIFHRMPVSNRNC